MNLHEGGIGRQEATCLAVMGVVVSGLFYPNAASLYTHGNAGYLSALVTLLLLLLIFFLVTKAMERRAADHLGMLLCDVLGSTLGAVVGLLIVAFLIVAAAVPLIQFQMALLEYVFPNARAADLSLYFLPALLALACAGLETLGRTARFCFWPFAIAFVLPLLLPITSYEAYYLFPLPFEAPLSILQQGVTGLARGLAPLLSLLICAKGMFGVRNASQYGRIAVLAGGALVCISQLCIGMAYCYLELQDTLFPMYRMLMTSNSGIYLRMDKLLLFFWIMTGVLSSAFYLYAAALLFCQTTGVKDVRPAALSLGGCCMTLLLLANLDAASWLRGAAPVIMDNLYLAALLPPLLAALLAFCKRERAAV